MLQMVFIIIVHRDLDLGAQSAGRMLAAGAAPSISGIQLSSSVPD